MINDTIGMVMCSKKLNIKQIQVHRELNMTTKHLQKYKHNILEKNTNVIRP